MPSTFAEKTKPYFIMPEKEIVNQEERELAEEMLYELEGAYFEVVLIPAPDPQHSGHKVRALQSGNPKWYSVFCSRYMSCRGIGRKKMKRARTFIDKRRSVSSLERVSKGEVSTPYDERFIKFIRERIEERKTETQEFNPEESNLIWIGDKCYNL